MDKDAIAFLDGDTVEEPEVTEMEAEAPPEPEQKEAAKPEAVEPEQTGEPESVPPTPEPETDNRIPVTALLDEREKRQDAQRRFEEADRARREMEAELKRLQQPKQEAPDWYEDPQAAAKFQTQNIEQQFQSRLLQMSKFQAERDFGAEVVTEAVRFFDKHPEASQQFKAHPSPFHAAVEFYQRQKVAEEIGTDPDAYKARLREEMRAELEAELTANGKTVQPTKPKSPPPSVASAPAQGRETIVPGNAFDGMFPD